MDLLTRDLEGPLAVIRGERGWITDAAAFTIGSTVGGDRIRLEVPNAKVPGLGPLSATVSLPGAPRSLLLGDERWEILVADLQGRSLHADGRPIEAFGFRLSATPAPLSKVAWMTEFFIGSPAARQFIEELQAAAARPPFEPWTPEVVTDYFVERFKQSFPQCEFASDGHLNVRYSVPDGLKGWLDLANVWADIDDEPAGLERKVNDRIGGFRDMLAPDRPARDQVSVSVKHTAQVEHYRKLLKQEKGKLGDIMVDHIAGDAWALYVLDRPKSIEPLRVSIAESLGIASTELAGLAAENIWRSHEAFQVHGIPKRTHLMVTCGGNYEASLLTVPMFWSSIESVLGSEFVVCTPTRDVLLIGETSRQEVIVRIRTLAKQIFDGGSYQVSDQLLTRSGETWKVYKG